MSISKEAIEAGARALFAVENCDRRQVLDVESNWRGRLNDANREEYRILATAALTAAAPYIAAEAVRAELMEVALMLEPFSGIGLANGATRNDVANWLRARADQLEKGQS